MDQNLKQELNREEFTRLANNFYNSINSPADYNRIAIDSQLMNYISGNRNELEKKHKVAFVFICLNPLYWQYASDMVTGARQFFLPGHQTDFLFWTDIPEKREDIEEKLNQAFTERGIDLKEPTNSLNMQNVINNTFDLRKQEDIFLFPTEPIEWPYPTLLRYNLFLQQEEKLKEYDYIFYCDIDMKFVNVVGDEILGEGLTAAVHPMYYVRKELNPPYEPNKDSTAYINRPGRIIEENGKPRFAPIYYAGGFQGGKSDVWIKAMKTMRGNIDKDLTHNYIAIWNDESHWNRYLLDNTPSIILTPSYIYPDSLIEEYYVKLWGCNYMPKLITLTKWFSLSKEGGDHVQQVIKKL